MIEPMLLEETCITIHLVFFFAVDVFEKMIAEYLLWSL